MREDELKERFKKFWENEKEESRRYLNSTIIREFYYGNSTRSVIFSNDDQELD